MKKLFLLSLLAVSLAACGTTPVHVTGDKIDWVEKYLKASCDRAFRCCPSPTDPEKMNMRQNYGPDAASCIWKKRTQEEQTYMGHLFRFQTFDQSKADTCLKELAERPCSPQGHKITECAEVWKGAAAKEDLCFSNLDCLDSPAACSCATNPCAKEEMKRCRPYTYQAEGEECSNEGAPNPPAIFPKHCDSKAGYYCDVPEKQSKGVCRKYPILGEACAKTCFKSKCESGTCVEDETSVSCYGR